MDTKSIKFPLTVICVCIIVSVQRENVVKAAVLVDDVQIDYDEDLFGEDLMSSNFMPKYTHPTSISNQRQNILTAEESKYSDKREKNNVPSPSTQMKSIFTELKTSKHHKLTRSDIRQLAKKAIVLAALKKVNTNMNTLPKSSEKPNKTPIKPTNKVFKKKHAKKAKKKQRKEAKRKEEKMTTISQKESEMAEDISHSKKKEAMELSDDAMSSAQKLVPEKEKDEPTSENKEELMESISKKSNIPAIDKSIDNIFEDDNKPPEMSTKSTIPTGELSKKLTSIKEFLTKADETKIPVRFLPDLPNGLRMIGWKELIEKKKKQLQELESTVGTEATSETKPVTINIDVDQDSFNKATATAHADEKQSDDVQKSLLPLSSDKNSDTNPITIQHVGFLQRHLSSARELRKLIAKTLVGHCKSTGQRILDAFVAMDKALARAQTIANVIGKKFNIDTDRIDALVGDKEDQVVETFLKDIFTKI